jgi:hypothetical protein
MYKDARNVKKVIHNNANNVFPEIMKLKEYAIGVFLLLFVMVDVG